MRHTIERAVTEVVDRFGQLAGPRPLTFDTDVAARVADVALYVRQHGGNRDLVTLGADPRHATVMLHTEPDDNYPTSA